MRILITGINGFVGSYLSELLKSKGHEVIGLSHSKESDGVYLWNIQNNYIDVRAFEGINAVINIAGENIAQRWTAKAKKRIYDSRVKGTVLLFDKLKECGVELELYIGMSAVGIYGILTPQEFPLTEDAPFGKDFLAGVCKDWEVQHNLFNQLAKRTLILRSGTIMHKKGGVLKKLLPFAKLGILSELGRGNQILSWISLNDLASLIYFLIFQTKSVGVFNAVTGNISNIDFTKVLLAFYRKKVVFPAVPAFFMNLILGEMSSILLSGTEISNQKSKQILFNIVDNNLNKVL